MPPLNRGTKRQFTVYDTCGTKYLLTLGTWEKRGAGQSSLMYNLTGHLPFLRAYGLELGHFVVFR